MKIKLFDKKKDAAKDVVDTDNSAEIVEEPVDVADDSMDEMQKVARTISEIKKQTPIQALLSGSKNERALAENDALISNVIKNILNWLAVITSAETIRKEEYDSLTSQMLQLDEDVNAQFEMQVKFKKAYQSMVQKQEEQKVLTEKVEKLQKEQRELTEKAEKLHKENVLLKIVAIGALCLSIVAILVTLL